MTVFLFRPKQRHIIVRSFSIVLAPKATYCSGYTDQHGHWNNGFSCPPEKQFCCGVETHRYCCVEQTQPADTSNTTTFVKSHVPLVVGLSVSLAVLCIVAAVIFCLYCKCCLLYKRRKRRFEDFDGMTGEEMSRYFSNEFVLVPGQGTFCPAILEASEHSSQKSLCPRELRLLRSNACNINEAYSSSNVSDVTLQSGVAPIVTPQLELENSSARYSNTQERDSGCYVTQCENEFMGVSSLFATLERGTMKNRGRYDVEMRSCQDEECCETELLSNHGDGGESNTSQSGSDTEQNEQTHMVTEVPCCQRNSDPHMHSKV